MFLLPSILVFALNTKYPIIAMRTGSMEPEIQEGDLLFVIGIEPRNIKNRSIIVYDARGLANDPGRPVIHRVIGISEPKEGEYEFITKGDANKVKDTDPVEGYRVFGIVYGKLSNIGWAVIAFEDWHLLIPSIGVSVTILIIKGKTVITQKRRR